MNRILYLDCLRLFATLGVIHAHSTYHYKFDASYFDWCFSCVRDSTTRWIIAVFFMISGSLLLNPERSVSIKEILTVRFPRLVIAYLSWFFLYGCFSLVKTYYEYGVFSTYHFTHQYDHLWFLPVMAGVYLLVPFLRLIIVDEQITKYALVVWFVAMFIEFLYPLFFDKIDITHFFYYVIVNSGFLLLGYKIHISRISQRAFVVICMLGVFGFVGSAWGTYVLSDSKGPNHVLFMQNIGPFVTFEAIAVFVIFMKLENVLRDIRFVQTIIKLSYKDLFGIYLVHLIWLESLMKLDFLHYCNGIVVTFFVTIFTFLFSLYSVKLIRKIPFVHKIVD